MSWKITVNGRGTSMRLEEVCWEAIDEICIHESVNLNVLCTAIDQRSRNSKGTATVRALIVSYLRDLAENSGFVNAGRIKRLIPNLALQALN